MDMGEEGRAASDWTGTLHEQEAGQPDLPEDLGEAGQRTGKKFGCSPNMMSCALLLCKQMALKAKKQEGLDPKANI